MPTGLSLSETQQARADRLLEILLELHTQVRADYLSRNQGDSAVLREVERYLRANRELRDLNAVPAEASAPVIVAPSAPDVQVGPWKITRLIGRGGMGVVYEGARTHGDFAQRVAIKLLRNQAVAQLERFNVERQILARLAHPGIARLYDGGVAPDGRPYMVMEFIAGEPITDYCARNDQKLPERMRLFNDVCDAVAYAHRNLVVHRDLKPANILVTAEGQVKLLDFGIAKLLAAEDRELTLTEDAPLTPSSAAPEQLLGGAVTTATDVYTLGLLLFELLTGTPPWPLAGKTLGHAISVILEEPAPSPSNAAAMLLHPPLPPRLLRGDFDAIVAKALRKEPIHRYETVDALKQDVERAMRGEAVVARDGARMYQFGRLLRRYRWGAIAVAAVVLSLAGGVGVAALQTKRAQVERDAARVEASREEALRYQLTRLFRSVAADRGAHAPPSAKAVLDASAGRVLHEYRGQPRLQGELVITLTDLYGTLQDVQGAAALLEEFLKQADSNVDPADLADARQKFANIELSRGNVEHAGQLLTQAENFWASVPTQYAEERVAAIGLRARQLRAAGNLDGAIATMRLAIARRVALSGRNNRETAVLYNSFALILTSAHRLAGALSAYREAVAIYQAVGLSDEIDVQIVLGNMGVLELRTGHLHEAETTLQQAVQHQRELAGDSAAVAAALGSYGRVLLVTNRVAQALPVLKEASDLGAQYAGPSSPVAIQNRLFLGQAQLATGDLRTARATLTADHDAASAQYGPTDPVTLRLQLALVRLMMATGEGSQAQLQLLEIIPVLQRSGAMSFEDLAQAQLSLGEILAAEHQGRQAAESFRQAIAAHERAEDFAWELAIARERLGEVLGALGDASGRRELQQAYFDLKSQLGTQHPETVRAEHALRAL